MTFIMMNYSTYTSGLTPFPPANNEMPIGHYVHQGVNSEIHVSKPYHDKGMAMGDQFEVNMVETMRLSVLEMVDSDMMVGVKICYVKSRMK